MRSGALARVASQPGIYPETLQNWLTRAAVDTVDRPGTTTSDAQRMAVLVLVEKAPAASAKQVSSTVLVVETCAGRAGPPGTAANLVQPGDNRFVARDHPGLPLCPHIRRHQLTCTCRDAN